MEKVTAIFDDLVSRFGRKSGKDRYQDVLEEMDTLPVETKQVAEEKEKDLTDLEKMNLESKGRTMLAKTKPGQYLSAQLYDGCWSNGTIAGKTYEQWKEHFTVAIPVDLNPRLCIQLGTKLMELHQEASFLKSVTQTALSSAKNANKQEYREKFAKLVHEFRTQEKRIPAKDTLASLVELDLGDEESAISHLEMTLDFWKEILNNLAFCRKIIENSTFNLNIEAKALESDRVTERMLRNKDVDDYQ